MSSCVRRFFTFCINTVPCSRFASESHANAWTEGGTSTMLPSSPAHSPRYLFLHQENVMPSLTVTEKEHWNERIAKKIDKKIEAITAAEPGLLERIQRQAHQRALGSLGLAEIQTKLDTIASQTKELEKCEKRAHRAMLAAVRRVPI